MNRNLSKITSLLIAALLLTAALAGCGQSSAASVISSEPESSNAASVIASEPESSSAASVIASEPESSSAADTDASDSEGSAETEQPLAGALTLTVRFGDEGEPFTMNLYDNPTAAAIARHVGTADWRLPIYHYDDYDNWEVMQYYDIPSRYEIPSNPESVASEAAGAVYYSEPNRIVLFYGDAQVLGEYTPVGYFDNSAEFRSAVASNPVLEGWGNKIVLISAEE